MTTKNKRTSRTKITITIISCLTLILTGCFLFSDENVGKGEMVLIHAGTFQMGTEDTGSYERSIHTVELRNDFEMGRCEVTNAEFVDFMNDKHVLRDASFAKLGGKAILCMDYNVNSGIIYDGANWCVRSSYNGHDINYADMPVVYVTWWGAVEYCNWLSEDRGYIPAYEWDGDIHTYKLRNYPENKGYRLPTEAEWEFAARGGEEYLYAGTTDNLGEYAWYCDNCNIGDGTGQRAQEVGQKKSNGYKLRDMSGNVWEWCSDNWYSYTENLQTDPYYQKPGNTSFAYRVLRGGSWYDNADSSRVSYRQHYYGGGVDFSPYVGFRIARTK